MESLDLACSVGWFLPPDEVLLARGYPIRRTFSDVGLASERPVFEEGESLGADAPSLARMEPSQCESPVFGGDSIAVEEAPLEEETTFGGLGFAEWIGAQLRASCCHDGEQVGSLNPLAHPFVPSALPEAA